MVSEQRFEVLESEVALIKGEIKQVLVDLKDLVMRQRGPFPEVIDADAPSLEFPPTAPSQTPTFEPDIQNIQTVGPDPSEAQPAFQQPPPQLDQPGAAPQFPGNVQFASPLSGSDAGLPGDAAPLPRVVFQTNAPTIPGPVPVVGEPTEPAIEEQTPAAPPEPAPAPQTTPDASPPPTPGPEPVGEAPVAEAAAPAAQPTATPPVEEPEVQEAAPVQMPVETEPVFEEPPAPTFEDLVEETEQYQSSASDESQDAFDQPAPRRASRPSSTASQYENGASLSELAEQYTGGLSSPPALPDYNGPTVTIDANLVANLVRWIGTLRPRIGIGQMEVLLDVYRLTGHLPPEVEEFILKVANMESLPDEPTEEGFTLDDFVDSLLKLQGIISSRMGFGVQPPRINVK